MSFYDNQRYCLEVMARSGIWFKFVAKRQIYKIIRQLAIVDRHHRVVKHQSGLHGCLTAEERSHNGARNFTAASVHAQLSI
jgi:hypothetical protein